MSPLAKQNGEQEGAAPPAIECGVFSANRRNGCLGGPREPERRRLVRWSAIVRTASALDAFEQNGVAARLAERARPNEILCAMRFGYGGKDIADVRSEALVRAGLPPKPAECITRGQWT
jgi:hypothetical protein